MTSTRAVLDALRAYESPNVTHLAPDLGWPIVWDRAKGCEVRDPEGRRYLDLTAAFGVAAAGHANPRVVRAGQDQMARLLHAMGDVHPHPLKARLARELSAWTFERWTARRRAASRETGRTIFCNSGFEAVEAALKTARLATGRQRVLAFEGAYHGLGYGALNATHRDLFWRPFANQLRRFCVFAPFPAAPAEATAAAARAALARTGEAIREAFRAHSFGAVLVEPIQARGGIRIPPPGFLALLRALCDEHGALLIADEIYTGFGRAGTWFACEREGVVPDLVCVGKALAGGFPLSACVGRASLMDAAWPRSEGEAIHTSTFLGHPVGCAMALANLQELRRRKLADRAARMERPLGAALAKAARAPRTLRAEARVAGLMAGVELRHRNGAPAGAEAVETVRRLLRRGVIALPEGPEGEVIGITPPLVIAQRELLQATRMLEEELARW